MYALRYSPNIHNDIQRGWSAWMGMRFASYLDLVNTAAEISEYDYAEWAEARDLDTESEETAEEYVNHLGWHTAIDPHTNEVCCVHHDGLSVYGLDAETLAEAVTEGRAQADFLGAAWGFGYATVGTVKIAADLGDNWYVLEVEDMTPEN